MSELEIAGIGVWSPGFSDWNSFSDGINRGHWQSEARLQPDLIPARERRRAPQSVKLAVEVMSQACAMADISPANVAAVFSSAMGDMQITDYLCQTLTTPPRLVSPTRFHNSVHNATTGYWSIASLSHRANNAVSAYTYTASMAFLEAAIQSFQEDEPVLLVTQEMAAPPALKETCPSILPFSAALLLTPVGYCKQAVATVCFEASSGLVEWPELPADLAADFAGNFGAKLVPLLACIAASSETKVSEQWMSFPLSPNKHLRLSVI